MASVNGPLQSADARGSVGSVTYARNESGAIARARTSPPNPNSELQQQWRAAMTATSDAWLAGLLDGSINYTEWLEFSVTNPSTNRFGNTYNMQPRLWFLRFNCIRSFNGESLITSPPGAPSSLFHPQISLGQNLSGIFATVSTALSSTQKILVSKIRPQNVSVFFAPRVQTTSVVITSAFSETVSLWSNASLSTTTKRHFFWFRGADSDGSLTPRFLKSIDAEQLFPSRVISGTEFAVLDRNNPTTNDHTTDVALVEPNTPGSTVVSRFDLQPIIDNQLSISKATVIWPGAGVLGGDDVFCDPVFLGRPWLANEATYNVYADPFQNWGIQGCNSTASDASASLTTGVDISSPQNIVVTATTAVQDMLISSTLNNSFVLRNRQGTSSPNGFFTTFTASESIRPRILVTYSGEVLDPPLTFSDQEFCWFNSFDAGANDHSRTSLTIAGDPVTSTGIIRFALDEWIDKGLVATSATITITVSAIAAAGTFHLDQLRNGRAWDVNFASWNNWRSGENWSTGGALNSSTDYDATNEQDIVVSSVGQTIDIDITDIFNAWLDLSLNNNGLLFRPTLPTTTEGFGFHSSTAADPDDHPLITVVWS